MKMRLLKTFLITLILIVSINGCQAYIEFEKMRLKLLVIIFVVSLIIGLIGLAFRDRN